MKTRIILGLILVYIFIVQDPAKAQLGKKLKAKLEKAASGKGGGFPSADESQSVTAAAFESKTYKYWKSNGSYTGGTPTGSSKLEIVKDDNGKVKHIVQDDKVKYLPDENGKSDFVRYFKCETNNFCMFFAKGRIFYFTLGSEYGSDDIKVYWKGIAGKPAPYDYIPKIEKFITESRKNQLADIEKYKAAKKANEAAMAAARKKKYSLEGKDVKSIKIVNFKKNSHLSNFAANWSFDIEATLKDGTVISTAKPGEGFTSDYKIEYINLPKVKEDPRARYTYGSKLTTGFVKGDKIIVRVQSIHHPQLKDQQEMVMTYTYKEGKVAFNRSAGVYGRSGEDLKLEIKKVKHAVTGVALYQYRLYNQSLNFLLAEGKLDPSQQLVLITNGQPGAPHTHSTTNGSRGGNAGNGGNVIIIKDPSIKSLTGVVVVQQNGGAAGTGVNSLYDGKPGRDGQTQTSNKNVVF